MLKWKLTAILGVACGLAGVSWGYAQQQTFPGFYELRIYKAHNIDMTPSETYTAIKITEERILVAQTRSCPALVLRGFL